LEILSFGRENVQDDRGNGGVGAELVRHVRGHVVRIAHVHRPRPIADLEDSAPFEDHAVLRVRVRVAGKDPARFDAIVHQHRGRSVGHDASPDAR